jgi:hypothetical protein
MEVHFIVLQNSSNPKKFKLTDNEYVILGRSPKLCQVTLEDDLCSSKHCRVSLKRGIIVIEDLKSKNGVYLNGVRILKQKVYINDKVKFGLTSLYINPKRMEKEDVDKCTYKGHTEIRGVGNLTLELVGLKAGSNENSENISSPPQIKLLKNTRAKLKQSAMTRQKATKEKQNKESEPILSRRKLAIIKYFSNLIDAAISAILFFIFIYNFKSITPELEILSKENNLLKFIFLPDLLPFTGVSFIVSLGIYIINRRLEPASIGEKLLRVNKDVLEK